MARLGERSSRKDMSCVVKIYSFEEFANQVEYYVDVASDARSDFAVFPEIFTTRDL
jgi:predicted amidohydrolase